MSEYLIDETLMTALANQVRRISGTEDTYNGAQLVEELQKIQGYIIEPEGQYIVRALGYNSVVKSSNLNTGMVFTVPIEETELPEGYVHEGWQVEGLVIPNYIIVSDSDIDIHEIYNTQSGASEFTTVSTGRVKVPKYTNATNVDWGGSGTKSGQYYNYDTTGIRTIYIYGATTFSNLSNITTVSDYYTDIKLANSVTNIGEYAFCNCGTLLNIIIPNSVTSIGKYAFYGCGLNNVIIPDSVTSIGEYAFYGCNSLVDVLIGNSVTNIGAYAFFSCRTLLNIIIPDSVTSIGEYAFYGCNSLAEVTLGNNLTTIGTNSFDHTPITTITIPDSVTSIGEYAFSGSNLENINFGQGVTAINYHTFAYCRNLKSVNIPSNIITIGKYAFRECTQLTSCNIEHGVQQIDTDAFYKCTSLTTITIPDSVTSIGEDAFYGCNSLVDVLIGNGVVNIGEEAFCDCTSLTNIDLSRRTTVPALEASNVFTITSDLTIKVPSDLYDEFTTATNWSDYASYMVAV